MDVSKPETSTRADLGMLAVMALVAEMGLPADRLWRL